MKERWNRVLEYENRLIQDRQQLLDLLKESDGKDSQLMQYKLECFQKEIAFMNHQLELLKAETGGYAAVMSAAMQSAAQQLHPAVNGQQPAPVQNMHPAANSQQTAPEQNMHPAANGQQTTPEQNMPPAANGQQPAPVQNMHPAANSQQPAPVQNMHPAANGQQATPEQNMPPATNGQQAMQGQKQSGPVQIPRQQPLRTASTIQPTKNIFEKQDFEKTVGKSLMGIFASVLIFISLILFATLLLPYFNDTAKMATTYIVSFGFLGVGMYKLKKDKSNKFFLALTGCGMGALYISLLLSNMYFKVLGDIPLYILIAIWGIGVSFFAKRSNQIFQIIGELGILISVIFGCMLCTKNDDATKFLALLIFYVISSGAFYLVHYGEEFYDNLIHQIFNIINVFLLAISCLNIVGNGAGHFETWLVLAMVAVSFASTLWHKLEKESISFGLFGAGYVLMANGILDSLLAETKLMCWVAYLITIPLLIVVEWKAASRKEGKYIVQTALLYMAVSALSLNYTLYDCALVPLLILPVVFAGFWRKNELFKYAGLVLLTVYTFDYSSQYEVAHFFLEGAGITVIFGLLWWKKEQYSKVYKYCLHGLTLLFLFVCTSDTIRELFFVNKQSYGIPGICDYMVFTLFNIAMMKSAFGKNLATGEKENPTLYNIANMLAMTVGLFMVGNSGLADEGIWHLLLIMTVVGAFLLNAKNLLDKRDNLLAGIYVGLKFTVLMIVVLNSFDAVNYVISMVCLISAIAGIVLGFAGQYKSLRIFGLILSMISIFKLIMVDIGYDNTLGNAISFFVSGILCFAISLIYNYIDGKMKENQKQAE